MENDLVHAFDDVELNQAEDKGKRPLLDDSDDSDAEDGGAGGSGAGGGCASGAEGTAEGEACPPSPRGSEPGDLTCAICLGGIPLENMALVKGCDHMYCATCILHWALHKEEPWCPQCKQPFSYLLTYRGIDGELNDFPSEEPVCLLKRAPWFEQHLRFTDAEAAALVDDSRAAEAAAWQEYGDDELALEEELERFYFSSAAGRARVVLGNRRHGEGGFISGGRRQARPVVERKRSNKMGKSGEHAVVGVPPVPPAFRTPNAGGGRKARPGSAGASMPVPFHAAAAGADALGCSPGSAGGSAIYGSSPSGSGRRARRNARRAAADAGLDAAAGSWGSVRG